MKIMMCKELGGACDKLITGNSPDEMSENCKQHAMQMIKQGDDEHFDALHAMRDMSPGEFATFWVDFRKAFEEADDT